MVDFKVGDIVELGGNSDWADSEGEVMDVGSYAFNMKVTKRGPSMEYEVGTVVFPNITSVSRVVGRAPKVVDFKDVEMGDTVRVTYPESVHSVNGVKETHNRVREGVVESTLYGHLRTKGGEVIDDVFAGYNRVTYEILSRRSWVDTAEIGDKFLLTDEGGNTLFVKDRPYDWTIYYNGTKESRSSASVGNIYGLAEATKL